MADCKEPNNGRASAGSESNSEPVIVQNQRLNLKWQTAELTSFPLRKAIGYLTKQRVMSTQLFVKVICNKNHQDLLV